MYSQDNLKIIQDWYNTHNSELLDSKCVWKIAEGFPCGGTYIGPKAILQEFFPNLLQLFTSFKADVDKIVNCENNMVIALGNYKAVTQKTQVEIKIPFVHLWKVKFEKIVEFQNYTDTLQIANALNRVPLQKLSKSTIIL